MPAARLTFALLLCAASAGAGAEFYRWVDEHGYVHISSVPRAGVRSDGTLRPEFDPRHVASQYPAMLRALREQGEALRREAEERAAQEAEQRRLEEAAAARAREQESQRAARVRAVEPGISLLDLIELEKRGGRAAPPVPAAERAALPSP